MALYKLKAKVGSHMENGSLYKAGEVVESDKDLACMFPHKFEVVQAIPQQPHEDATLKTTPQPAPAVEDDDRIESTQLKSLLGSNVTGDFEDALDMGLVVFKKANKYNVAHPDILDESLNTKPLTKLACVKFLANWEDQR